MKEQYTKFEIARIIGARALQIAMDAPILYDIPEEKLEQIRYDPIKIAEIEFNAGILPISVKRPMPKKTIEKIKPVIEDEQKKKEVELKEDEKIKQLEKQAEADVRDEGEIMELARPDDEHEAEEKEEEE
ncbi:DNA-directed RNA polymerase subunit K [Candidatus Pacearchaeota archaeon]|nr:DNA-directed RNA polymerase subunit K [Candidatus Pacearchaeota archaeon]